MVFFVVVGFLKSRGGGVVQGSAVSCCICDDDVAGGIFEQQTLYERLTIS